MPRHDDGHQWEFIFCIPMHMYSLKRNTSHQSIDSNKCLYFLGGEVIFFWIYLQEILRCITCCGTKKSSSKNFAKYAFEFFTGKSLLLKYPRLHCIFWKCIRGRSSSDSEVLSTSFGLSLFRKIKLFFFFFGRKIRPLVLEIIPPEHLLNGPDLVLHYFSFLIKYFI